MTNQQDKLQLMLSLQEGVNSIINPEWKDADQAWHRAIWMECAEILEREGDWKWWKAAPKFADQAAHAGHLEQQQIELCDIWHFLLSWALQDKLPENALLPTTTTASDKNEQIESLVLHAVAQNLSASIDAFYACCTLFQLDFDRLFELYVGKNVVNRFRQDRGYKTGEYRKVFAGLEDNEHLSEIMAEIGDVPIFELADELYSRLALRYDESA
ncbi:MAG: dUTP diphosphatase [Oceanococcus sp.]